MKSLSILASLFISITINVYGQQQRLVITGIIDGPLSGGTPKAIELYAILNIADLSMYGVTGLNNGKMSTGNIDYNFPSESVEGGEFIYVVNSGNTDEFELYFGDGPLNDTVYRIYEDGALQVNGNDAIELYYGNTVIDVYGEPGVDGSGEPWDYLNGWGYRVNGTQPSSTFNLNNWYFSGVDALDGTSTNDEASKPFPLQMYVPPELPPMNTTYSPSSVPSSVPTYAPTVDNSMSSMTTTENMIEMDTTPQDPDDGAVRIGNIKLIFSVSVGFVLSLIYYF